MNDSRRPDPLRDVCDELAARLSTEDGLRTARLLQTAGLAAAVREDESGRRPAPLKPDLPAPISIWRPEQRDGELVFVRPEPSPLGDHYATRREIPAKKAPHTRRVAFFGESVAAGYLYAPHLTPAAVLQHLLDASRPEGAPRHEVLDFARTNETLGSLTATVAASLQLTPDLLVLFAGNNWNLLETPEVSPYYPSVRGRQRYALALRRGLTGPRDLARSSLTARVRQSLADVARLAGDLPVVLVIPEVNLADWGEKQPVPWLDGDDTAGWHELFGEALRHLESGRFQRAADTAALMNELDRGLAPTSEHLRARALAGLGDERAARLAFEASVAASSYATAAFLGSPRASIEVHQLLRQAADHHGFQTVDLPAIFERHTGSPLPGRRLFLDYCHLTGEGMEVAMSAVAGAILGEEPPIKPRPSAQHPEIPPAVEAIACLGAAIHTGHRLAAAGAKGPLLRCWLRDALDADPRAADTLLDLALVRCAPSPELPSRAQERSQARPVRLLHQHGWNWEHLDAELLRALVDVLEERGHRARATVHEALLRHHGAGSHPRDLSRPPYLWEPVERFYPEAMDETRHAFFRAAWPTSSFCLVADGRQDVELEITARLHAVEGAGTRTGTVTVEIDGQAVGKLDAGEAWRRGQVAVPCARLGRVLHRLTLRWPALPPAGESALESARRRLELGVEADVHPVFGEVFALRARIRSGY